MALQMEMSVCVSVHHFDLYWNISTTIEWKIMQFCNINIWFPEDKSYRLWFMTKYLQN